MALGVVRMKRKAFEEPAEALVIALKKSKIDDEQCEIHLKFAATIPKAADFECKQIEAAITLDQLHCEYLRQSPKHIPKSSTSKRIQYFKAEQKLKRDQVVAGRRLILTQSAKQDESPKTTNDIQMKSDSSHNYVLYDIIEENEDMKSLSTRAKNKSSKASVITCNGQPFVKVSSDFKSSDYVYDVYYITKGDLDKELTDGPVSIQPCDPNTELVNDDDPEEHSDAEVYYDEDDSNEEDNWRNDYPDEDSDFEKERDYFGEYDDEDDEEVTHYTILNRFKKFQINEKESDDYAIYKTKVLQEIASDDDDSY